MRRSAHAIASTVGGSSSARLGLPTSGMMHSAGSRRAISRPISAPSSPSSWAHPNSPVVISAYARPHDRARTPSPGTARFTFLSSAADDATTDTRKLFRRPSSIDGSITVPAVTTRVTSRDIIVFAPDDDSSVSPICSQTATLNPAWTMRARYPCTAWAGTPAIGTRCPRPISRPVRVIWSTRAQVSAS